MTKSTNFDAAELARFQSLADRWWDQNSEFWPLHQLNPVRLEWIDGLATLHGKKVLDVGCGGGILAEAMAKRGAFVTGIDLADKPLKVAMLHAQKENIEVEYRAIAAEDLALEALAKFDVVTCMEMLEHVPDPAKVVLACAQMVKPGGWVFFSTINRNPLAYMVAILGAERVLRILPVGTHDYTKFIQPRELKGYTALAGLSLVEERGLGFNLFTRRFKLHRFTGVDYLFAMQKV